MKLPRHARRKDEQGYVLLLLLLSVALFIIFAAVIVPTIKYQIEHDREEEMIHRGVQFERAIRIYYKKFNRYPTKIEDLESTNNLRFLRKRYKDPTNCKDGKCEDFKLLHFGEVKLAFSGAIGGGTIPGASPIGGPAALNGQGLGQTSNFLSNSGGQTSAFGGTSGLGQTSSFGNSTLGGNAPTNSNPSSGQGQQSDTQPAGGDVTDASTQVTPQPGTTNKDTGDQLSTQVFGGGPIVGVASLTKKTGYREFNHKKKYSEWQFIYDPGMERGMVPMTPYQPQLQAFGTQGLNSSNNGQSNNGTGSANGTSFGPSSFGQPSGTQNNSNPGYGTPTQPNSPPEQ